MEVFVQLIGWLGTAAGISSFQCKKHKGILLLRTLCEALFAVQYVFLGSYTGAVMNVISSIRNVIFTRQVAKNKSTTAMVVLFSAVIVVFGALTWQGWTSVLAITAKIISTVSYGNKNPRIIRGLGAVTGSGWLVHNVLVGSAAGVANEIFTLVSIAIATVRLDLIPYWKSKQT